ncbi:thiolase-like protein [Mycena capillaripes]|nr:thiolase-like protein [Mycena capillaripes]
MPSPSLKVTGFGIAYPPHLVPTTDLKKLAYKHYEPSPALDKVLAINRRTGIKTHSLISPLLDLPEPASIKETGEIFLKEGVALAVSASRQAIDEAGLAVEEITHIVATTCTNSSNPGYDSFLAQELGLRPSVEKVLLHGVGCAGGLAALRLAASLCQSAAWRGEPAHVLLSTCEISSNMLRHELKIINRDQQVLKAIYELVNWSHITVPDTYSDLRIDVTSTDPPEQIHAHDLPSDPQNFDWAVHPGGAAILMGIQAAMGVKKEHMRASWDYENHGNTSSVSVIHVLDTVRRKPGREWVMSAAFEPGVAAEGALLRRIQ